jgi:hypothetical protein
MVSVILMMVAVAFLILSGDLALNAPNKLFVSKALLSSMGVTFLNVLASYIIINVLLTKMEAQRVRKLVQMDYIEFMRRLKKDRKGYVLDTYTELVEEPMLRHSFFELIRNVPDLRVDLLILNPFSTAAWQRTEELRRSSKISDVDVQQSICTSLRELRDFLRDPAVRDRVDVRVYDASPSIAVYGTRERLIVAFFPIGRLSRHSLQVDLPMTSQMGEFFFLRFQELWNNPHNSRTETTISLNAYFTIDLWAKTRDVKFADQWYVKQPKGGFFVAGEELTAYKVDNNEQQFYLEDNAAYKVINLPLGDEYAAVRLLFIKKYGQAPSGLIFRLEKPLEALVQDVRKRRREDSGPDSPDRPAPPPR